MADATSPSVSSPIPVTADNSPRAETDLYFSNIIKGGAFGKFLHHRQPAQVPVHNRATTRRSRRNSNLPETRH